MIRFAHQYGWDEILWFAAPAVLAWFALRWANRRATEREAEAKEEKRRREQVASEGGDEPTDG